MLIYQYFHLSIVYLITLFIFKNILLVQERFESSDEDETNEGSEKYGDSLEANNANEDEIPRAGMIFSSEDEITNYYKNYAQCLGYGIGKISTKNGDDGKKYFTLACSRARKYVSNSKNLLKPNRITKSQCKGRLKACMSLDETVIVSSVVLEHNHELSPTKVWYFRCNKKLGAQIRRLELNDEAGINFSRNF